MKFKYSLYHNHVIVMKENIGQHMNSVRVYLDP
jgi:hypothetical protein